MKKIIFVFGVLLTVACSLITQPIPVNVEPPLPSAVPPLSLEESTAATVDGISISANGTSFVIPQGVAGGADLKPVPSSPPSSADMPYWEVYPAYIEFDLSGYVLQNTFHNARVIVYPANDYAKMSEGAAGSIAGLQALIADPSAPLPQNIPFLPVFNAAQVFHSNEQFLKFQNGTGIRFLTQYGQAPFPANNEDLFYTFQGITDDGAYYVAALLPINIAFLSADGNPDTQLPPDGVPFDWNNFENIQAHFNLVVQKLNAADPNAFMPSLADLDAMIQSILAGIQ